MKRFLYIVGVLLTSVVLVSGICIAALMSDKVQNAAIQLCAEELSRGLGTDVKVGNISYEFPAKLRLHDLYLSDRQRDTLVYLRDAYAHFRPLSLMEDHIRFSRLQLQDGYIQVYKTSDGEYNYAFLQRAFQSKDKKTEPMRSILQIEGIELDRIRFRIDSTKGEIERTEIDIHYLGQDTIDAELGSLKAWVERGEKRMKVEDMKARVETGKAGVNIPTLYARLGKSEIDAGGVKISPDGELNMDIHQGQVCMNELALLLPTLETLDNPFDISGHIGGTQDSLQVKDMAIGYNGQQILLIDGCILQPASHNPRIAIDCRDIHASAALAQDLVADLKDQAWLMPAAAHRLGDMHYRGKIAGSARELYLHGGLSTQIGNLQLNGQMSSDSAMEHIHYKVDVETQKTNLGKLLAKNDFGEISVDLSAEGDILHGQPSGHIEGRISDFSFRHYNYEEMNLEGDFTPSSYVGKISIDDRNIGFQFNGIADWTDGQPKMNFTAHLTHFRPGMLKLIDGHPDLELGCNIQMDMDGKSLNDMLAHILLDSLHLKGNGTRLNVGRLAAHIEAEEKTGEKLLSLKSEMLKAEVSGQFRYEELGDILLWQLTRQMPSLVDPATKERLDRQKRGHSVVHLSLNAKRLRPLLKIIGSTIVVWGDVQMRGMVDENKQQMMLSGYIPRLKIGPKLQIHDLNLSFNNNSNQIAADMSMAIKGLHYSLTNHIESDSIRTELRLIKADTLGGGSAGWIGMDTKLGRWNRKIRTQTQILPSSFEIKDTLFHLAPSTIVYTAADTTIDIRHFEVSHTPQRLALNGRISPRLQDSLMIESQQVEGGPLLSLIVPERAFKMSGRLSGWVKAYGLLGQPLFESQLHIDDLGLTDEYIGQADGMISLDPTRTHLRIMATAYDSVRERALVKGDINMRNSEWKFDLKPTHFPIQFINYWTNGIVDDVQGYASGHVRVFGTDKTTYVLTEVKAEEASLVVPFTGCRYYLEDSIFMDSSSIRFPNLKLRDEEGHLVELDGIVKHKCFNNFSYQLEAHPYDARVLDLPDKDGEWLQGTVYAKGTVNITGDEHLAQVDATASTSRNSRFRMSISGASSADEHKFVRFINREPKKTERQHRRYDTDGDEEIGQETKKEQKKGTRVKLALNIDATQQLLFQLMMDERTGDKIEARGDGGLRFTYDSQTEDIQLLGTYILQSGKLSFTVGNVIRRDFTVQEGGMIVWNGDPVEPQVNATANYKVTANLKDLFGTEIDQVATTRTNVPVLTRLYLTGPLFSPTLRFAIDLPMSEDAIRQQVQSVINTDEMLMRQVVYLLVFGKFFTPEYMSSNQASGLNDTYSLLSSTITGQINQWLSKLTDVFTVGVNIRTDGLGAEASQEYEAEFQIQPVDRLLINGNVGYRYNDISNRPFFGDLDIEVLLTDNGRLRLRGYTHTVDKYSLRQASTIQGVGFVWKHDFDWNKKGKTTSTKTKKKNKTGTETK